MSVAYRCLLNFKDLGRTAGGEGIFLLAGQPYLGQHVEHFLAMGFIKKEVQILDELAKEAEAQAEHHLEAAKAAKQKAKQAKAKIEAETQ